MPFFKILLIALSMAMDAFAVCLAAGALEETRGPGRAGDTPLVVVASDEWMSRH